jgi:hypothetical protein
MPVPLQYQSQFIPTDFGTVQNILGMYRQDMGQREQQFDQGVAAEQMALADLAQMETTDQVKKQELIDSLRSRIEDVVNKRGGDYGAAAKDITRLIATEKANPWYQFDKAKLEALQDYYKMKNQLGINFYSAQDPNKVTLEQYLADPTALQFQAINVGDLKELAAAKAKEYATANKQFINRPTEGMMREIGWQLGMGDEAKASEYLTQHPEFIKDIADAHNISDPQVIAMMNQAALTQLVGKRETDFVADREALLKAEAAQRAVEQNPYNGIPLIGVGTEGVDNVYPIKSKKDFWNIPSNNSIEGLTKKSIFKDITSDKIFAENNKQYLEEFGSIENAKKIVDNYSKSGSVVDTPIMQEKLKNIEAIPGSRQYQIEIAKAYKELESQGKVDPQAGRKSLEEYNRAKKLVDNFDTVLKQKLYEANSDLKGKFKHFDPLAKVSSDRMKIMQEYISEQFDSGAFIFEGSDHPDIDFSELDLKELHTDENAAYAKGDGNLRPIGVAIDDKLGIKLLVKTKTKDGSWVTHIAKPANSDVENFLIRSYTNGDPNSPEFNTFKTYRYNKLGNALMHGLNEEGQPDPSINPKLKYIEGMTVGQYKQDLQKKVLNGEVNPAEAEAIITYLFTNYNNDITL